jgi:16S rRNA (guanine527-N7)-methyltransferase
VHFADSILGGQMLLENTDASEIFDLGSGNGFPGLVMAILDPSRQMCLVDSDTRKTEFLKFVAGRLELKNVTIMRNSIMEIENGRIQHAVSRGLANISRSLVMCKSVLAKNSQYYHFKGDGWFREIAEIPSQACAFFQPNHIGEYSLPVSKAKMSLVRLDKIK